mmetsp:Transcript_51005/g.65321  ORF Transcript_51005/g.65321 Transcript_51005/m.65321 type:complete len:153 (-) Transcript_51005:72-530(-)
MASTTHTSQDNNNETWFPGTCYCGNIKFEVRCDQVNKALFCHCESCRRAHSSPLYHVVYTAEESFKIIEGNELIKEFSKTADGVMRSFCTSCGSRIYNRVPIKPQLGVGFFPALLEETIQHNLPDSFKPSCHYLSEETVLDLDILNDNLPRT